MERAALNWVSTLSVWDVKMSGRQYYNKWSLPAFDATCRRERAPQFRQCPPREGYFSALLIAKVLRERTSEPLETRNESVPVLEKQIFEEQAYSKVWLLNVPSPLPDCSVHPVAAKPKVSTPAPTMLQHCYFFTHQTLPPRLSIHAQRSNQSASLFQTIKITFMKFQSKLNVGEL